MARVPGRAVLCLLSAAVIKVDAFFSKASIHWWELQQVRRKKEKQRLTRHTTLQRQHV
jgi:hypothetical protein